MLVLLNYILDQDVINNMKTIEERAYARYAGDDCPADCESCEFRTDCVEVDYIQAYIDGARSELDLLTAWHDPKEELPSIGVPVLLKVKGDGAFPYIVNIRTIHPILGEGWGDGCGGILDEQFTEVLGWREIHE